MQLPEFKLERYFAHWEFVAPHLLCASDVETHRLEELLALADDEGREMWEALSLGYTESAGHPLLRREIAGLYEQIAPDQLLVFSGAEEAIFILANVLLGPGDHAVVVWPAYQSLYEVARSTGAEVTLVPLDESAGWTLNVDALRQAVKPNTRLIVANYPHNPTGASLDRAEFESLVEVARGSGAYLLSDEVYRLLEYDPVDRLPAAADRSERAVSLGVMSKAFGLAGLRIGWLACRDAELLGRCAAYKDYTTICCSAPSEALAVIALRAREAILQRNREIVLSNLRLLDAFLERHAESFSWVRPRAGAIGYPKLKTGAPIEEFARDLVENQGVLLLPGTVYDDTENHFRIGFGRRDFGVGLERLEEYVG
jgi:aspartate/methionine/tyrosine aminotransferase